MYFETSTFDSFVWGYMPPPHPPRFLSDPTLSALTERERARARARDRERERERESARARQRGRGEREKGENLELGKKKGKWGSDSWSSGKGRKVVFCLLPAWVSSSPRQSVCAPFGAGGTTPCR